jgi:DNA-binding response OmpR family regulator
MNTRKPRILLIEDNPDLGTAAKIMLEHVGYDVHWSDNVADAYIEVVEDGFKAALLDLNVGADDGVSLICSLKSHGHHVPPIVVLSGHAPERLLKAASDTGALAVLQKPYDVLALKAALDDIIRTTDPDA